jgi:hypothetical protein
LPRGIRKRVLKRLAQSAETLHMDVLDPGFRKGFLQMFLIELWSVLGTRQRSNVYQTVYFELPENRRGVIPGSIRKSHRVDIERHTWRLCRQILRRINLVGARGLEHAKCHIQSGRVLGVDDNKSAALAKDPFEAWSGISRNPKPSQCTATTG